MTGQRKREPVIETAIQIEVILAIVTKYEKKFLPLVHMFALQIKQPLLLVVLQQRIKIINKLRPLHLQHQDRIVLSGICCPKVKLYLVKSLPYKVKHIRGFLKQLGSIVPIMLARIP